MMERQENLIFLLAENLGEALTDLGELVSSDEEALSLLEELGFEALNPPTALTTIAGLVEQLVDQLELVQDLREENIEDPVEIATRFANLIKTVIDIFKKIEELKTSVAGDFSSTYLAESGLADKLPKRLVDYLISGYLEDYIPEIHAALRLLGIITHKPQPAYLAIHQPAFTLREIHWGKIAQFLKDPKLVFQDTFGWGSADLDWELLVEILTNLCRSLSLPAAPYFLDSSLKSLLREGQPEPGEEDIPALQIPLISIEDENVEFGVNFLPLPFAGSPPGIALAPYLVGALEEKTQLSGEFTLIMRASMDLKENLGIVLIPGQPVRFVSTAAGAKGQLEVRLEQTLEEENEYIVLLGDAEGNRLEYRLFALALGLTLDKQNRQELYGEFKIGGGRIVVAPGQGDSFLDKILPPDGITVGFDVTLGWSSERGVYFQGSGGLEVMVPVHLSLGPVDLSGVYLGVRLSSDRKLPIDLAVSASAKLGPLTAMVDRVGFTAEFDFPGSGGNLGPIDIGFKFKPPNGIGLSIDGQGFKGGGFLLFDHDNQRYAGALELEFQNTISLKAIGLITTKLPGGEKGFSLLIIISAEFTPIQLGYGFTLNGVGGLLGLNRTMKVQRMLTGIKDNTLKSILFPTNIIANADRIISDLRQVFPPEQDRFVFGPMAKIGWGTPTLITIELGVIIEVPNPIRIALLGVLKALLPDEKLRLLRIQVNFLGVLDFQKQRLAFDASLYDSTLLRYTLSGDMALRLLWGNNPNFLLTVGGFHPAYNPPPEGLMKLVRLTLNLLGGKNPRLTLETYFAVTSNTVQFGAKIELYAAAWKFNVYGFLSFDVLFQFSPFYFIASIRAMLAVRIGSTSLFSVGLSLTLAGPTPWKAKGTAKFKICWFITVKVRFSKTFGESRDTCLPDIKVMPLLQSAIKNKGNWQAHIPPHSHLQVSIREIDDTDKTIIVHPFGILTVSQKVVPLNLKIDKFGNQKPKDTNQFRINEVRSNGDVLATTDVEEFFAPAQFFDMEDAQRLSRKSFEKYPSGVRIAASEKLNSDHYTKKDVEYELTYIDTRLVLVFRGEKYTPRLLAFAALLNGNAIAKSDLAFAKKAKSPLAPKEVTVKQERFAVVGTSDLKLFAGTELASSEAKAYNTMSELIANDSDLADKIQVVPQYEVNMS
jgi:hypothetical protein